MMNQICLFAAIFLGLASPAIAQLHDDFSDGDFTNTPEWLGDVDIFTVTNAELQLLDPAPAANNTAVLYLPAATASDAFTTWEFYVRLAFAPSTTNFARVYLSASNPDLAADQYGYYLKVGGISGADDAIELYRQDGASASLLLSGQTGAVGSDPAMARVRVERSIAGEWSLWADYSGGTNLQFQSAATDSTYPTGAFFGIYCRYTSTRNENFFFDDVRIDPLFTDTQPPVLLQAEATSATEVLVRFDEPLDVASASEPSRFTIDNGIGQPQTAIPQTGDPSLVLLNLATPLQNAQSYQLTVAGVSDANGNLAATQSIIFSFFNIQPAEFNDVIISEIFPDPNPSRGLPEGEYIELYNRSDKVIQLSTLRFSAGDTPRALPDGLLLPGAYLALCDDTFETALAAFGPAASLATFPALINSSGQVSLTDANGNLIYELAYNESWYRDETRADGGYSLELIQLEGPYDCPGNWRASDATVGGTPGQPNSLLGLAADSNPPSLLNAIADSEFEIRLTFSEAMDESSAGQAANYSLSPPLNIAEVLLQPSREEAILLLDGALSPGIAYELAVAGAVSDCMGNGIGSNRTTLGLAEPITTGEILINEVLFNPESGGYDFIELYNPTTRIFNLRGLAIENQQKDSGDTLAIIAADYLLLPQSYVVLTESPDDIRNRYFVETPSALLETGLPTLEDKTGNITLLVDGATIDSFDYSESFHYPLLDTKEGVSLERISANAPTQDEGNWHSAASTAGFATPTYRNSQFVDRPNALEQMIDIPNTTFSPDGDGFEDVLLINYQLDGSGYTLNLQVYDSQGRLVRRLANNEILAASGSLKWDGVTDDSNRSRLGIYVLWFELFTPKGDVERDKRAVVLAGRLE
ncbi:MAG: lamin tail domain-containing protein [Phaeodactylibacter sp.]|nr:lamin tail domain-containing protein [Phaeodactylibacter sp.]